MAKIKKVIENGGIQYPATITDAVKNPNNGKTVTEELSELGSKTSLIASDTLSIIDVKINESYKKQAVSGFITAPFRIETNTGYKIVRDTRYDKNFNEIDYTNLNVTAYYSDDNTAYHKLYFSADDDRYLSEDDINNIIKEFTGSKDRKKITVTQENGVLTIKSGLNTVADITITNDVSIAHDLKKAASSRALAIYKKDNDAAFEKVKSDIKNLSISAGELVPYQEFASTGLSTPIEIVNGKDIRIGDNLTIIINGQEGSGAYYYVKFIYNDLTEENYGKLTAVDGSNYNIDVNINKELSKILLYSNVSAAIAIRKESSPTILDNRLSIVEEDTKNIKKCGILLGRTILSTNGRTNALTVANIEDLIGQKTIYYKIDNVENPIGKYTFIEVFKSDGSKQVYGKGSGSSSQTSYTGEISITDDITKITYNSDTSADVLIYTDIANNILNDKVNILNDKVNAIESGNSVKEIKTPVFGYPTLGDGKYDILSTADEDVTEYDNKLMVYPWILKVSENLYYLYYNALGKTEEYTITEEGKTYIGGGQHLCIAYSTNGTEYHRGVPEGISTPIPGTHKLFERGVRSVSVVKVFDVEYPYRMICADMGEGELQMYKSKDAVNFTFVKNLTVHDGHYDSSTSSIVRGNMIKIYARGWSPTTNKPCRIIRALTVTIDGDLVCPATVAIDEEQLYTAGASPLDDRRDILFPCWYNDPIYYDGGDDKLTMKCIIVDGSHYKNISILTHNVQSPSDLQIYAANLVSIPCNRPQENPDPYNRYWNSDQRHLLVHVTNVTHNNFDDPSRIDKIRLCRMSFAEYNG